MNLIRRTYDDGSIYEGEFYDEMRHGYGSYTFYTNDFYRGNWRFDQKHGKGVYIFATGGIYEGDWDNGRKTGQGVFIFPSGDQYTGTWKDDKRNGFGIYQYNNGDRYEGFWFEDQKHGLGYYQYASGSEYIGEWTKGIKAGFGRFYFKIGDIYEGQWQEEKRNGWGIYLYARDGDRYYGHWRSDNKHGLGTYIYQNGDWYFGIWKDGEKEGIGVFHYAESDSQYIGFWHRNQRHGFGIYYFASGDIYKGYWKMDQKDGKGDYFYPNGDKFQGEWRDDQKSGLGTYFYGTGEIHSSKWRNGVKHDPFAKIFPIKPANVVIMKQFVNGIPQTQSEPIKCNPKEKPEFEYNQFQTEEELLRKRLKIADLKLSHPKFIIPRSIAIICSKVILSSRFSAPRFHLLMNPEMFPIETVDVYYWDNENCLNINLYNQNILEDYLKNKPLLDWSTEDVETWLNIIGVPNLRDLLRQNGVDGKSLSSFDSIMMKNFGFREIGYRIKIIQKLKAIREYQENNPNLNISTNQIEIENQFQIPFKIENQIQNQIQIENQINEEQIINQLGDSIFQIQSMNIGTDRFNPHLYSFKSNVSISNDSNYQNFSKIGIDESKIQKWLLDSKEKTIPEHLKCPISHKIMQLPVIASDEVTYDFDSIIQWMKSNDHSFVHKQIKFSSKFLIPNFTIHKLIEEFLEQIN